MPVVEPLEVLALPFEIRIAGEPLPPEELLAVGVVEAFYDAVAPRLSDRNEYRSNGIVWI